MDTLDIHDHVKHEQPFFEGTLQGIFRSRAGKVYCNVQTYDDRMFIVSLEKLTLVRKAHSNCKHDMGFAFLSSAIGLEVFTCRLGCGLATNHNPDNGLTILDKPGERHTKDHIPLTKGGEF